MMLVSEFIEKYKIGQKVNGAYQDIRAVVSVEKHGGFDNMQLRASRGDFVFNWLEARDSGFPDHNNDYAFFEEREFSLVSSGKNVKTMDVDDAYEIFADDGLKILVRFE